MSGDMEKAKASPKQKHEILQEIVLEASDEKLAELMSFIERHLEEAACPLHTLMQVCLVAEEVFVNIAHYAYVPDKGSARVSLDISGEPSVLTLTFTDRGIPYNPLARKDPDITLPADQRSIGGLGILLTKKMMDEAAYEYKDGQNILTLKKQLSARKKGII